MDQKQAQKLLDSANPRPVSMAGGGPRRGRAVRTNTLLALGLWVLLWGGYNTDVVYLESPQFYTSWAYFIHGVRAFFPMLAGWIAFLILLTRARRLGDWLVGPLGLLLLFSTLGIASSMTLSRNPEEALYFGANYLAIVLVLFAVVTAEDALADTSKLLMLNWGIAIVLTIGLLGAIPFVGGFAGGGAEDQAYTLEGVRNIYNGNAVVFGMAMTRNTGFARYAAIASLATLAKLRSGHPFKRAIWAGLFLLCFYSLILANGRTEVAAFIASAFLVLYGDRSKRVAYFIGGIGVAILLGLKGFYSAFFEYFTRTGRLDTTMTGRTLTWREGVKLLNDSPWVGWGFQADRIYLGMQHMHNAFLAALVQSGFVGGGALILAICLIWFLIVKYFFIRRPSNQALIPAEIPGIFLFVTISSVAESTFAYYSAAWLLSSPIVAYVLLLNQQARRASAAAEKARWQRARVARRQPREAEAVAPALNPSDIIGQTPH